MAIRSLKTGSLSRSAQAGNTMIFPGSYESIATVTPYTTTTTVVFSSIPSTFQHLQIRSSAASSAAANMIIRFNSDSGANYSYHYMEGTGAGISAGNGTSSAYILGPVTTNTASSYTGIIMDIVDYKDPNKYTTLRSLSGVDLNGSNTWINMFSGLWLNTAAITSVTLSIISGATFAANSHFALYGVK
jgi:hypothetical protein